MLRLITVCMQIYMPTVNYVQSYMVCMYAMKFKQIHETICK